MSDESLSDRFASEMGALLGSDFPDVLGLAVSGGGDSMAMLALTHEWARHMGVRLRVVTVDHGLRAGSAEEAARVAEECAVLGHAHTTLTWGWDGQGNLSDAARRARLSLVGQWANGGVVLFAHTRDDVAETLLMRLKRGSGVDGLATMRARQWVEHGGSGFWQVRPLLDERRETLRHYADTLRLPYVDDPSNEDDRFDRARIRKAIGELDLDVSGLAATAKRMSRARVALDARTDAVIQSVAREGSSLGHPTGIVELNRDRFAEIERETQLRLLVRALVWVSGADYPPREAPLEDALDRALAGGGTTLHGARIVVTRGMICVVRELNAVQSPIAAKMGAVWDGRWRFSGEAPGDVVVRALDDDGWRQIGEKPSGSPPHALAVSLPAVFSGGTLVLAPHFGVGKDGSIGLSPVWSPFVAGSKAH